MSLITELSSDFSSAVRSRGSDYFLKGRIKITNGSAWDVYAKVRGGRIYNVDLSIEEGDLVVHCDCSDFETEPCEHLWAAILAADGKGYLRGDGNLGPLEMVPEFDDDYDLYDGDKYEDEYEDEDEDEGGYGDEPLDRDIAPLFAGGARSKEKEPSMEKPPG